MPALDVEQVVGDLPGVPFARGRPAYELRIAGAFERCQHGGPSADQLFGAGEKTPAASTGLLPILVESSPAVVVSLHVMDFDGQSSRDAILSKNAPGC